MTETEQVDLPSEEKSLRAEVVRLNKVVKALVGRAERSASAQGSDFALFQTAVMLEDRIRNRTRELEAAVRENERVNRALQIAKEQMARLLDAERESRMRHEQAERKYRLIFENAQIGIFVTDRDGCLQSWNPALTRMLGLPARPAEGGERRLEVLLRDGQGRVAGLIGRALAERTIVAADLECGERRREARWVNLVLTPIEDGLLQGVVGDITERKIAESSAQAQAERDPLTDLLNRRGLERMVARPRPGRRQGGFAFLLVDLDGFKGVNDTLGHGAGDAVLRSVARQLEAAVRQGDLVARVGGDEFVLVLERMSSIVIATATAARVAEQVIAVVREPYVLGHGRQARIGASVGIAIAGREGENLESLLRRADQAMYRAKAGGKSGYRFAEPS